MKKFNLILLLLGLSMSFRFADAPIKDTFNVSSAINSVDESHSNCSHAEFITNIKIFSSNNTLENFSDRSDAKAKIEDYRVANNLTSNTKRAKNIGYLEGKIWNNGRSKIFNIDNTVEVSKGPFTPDPKIFEAIRVGGWIRTTDSEYYMLTKFAQCYGGAAGRVLSGPNGNLKIVSEFTFCASCRAIIQEQFRKMFPNIHLTLIEGL